ncbi:MAG: hypothetical protein GY810_29670 [Aureispira sp.]|nr:hypothetical protein [Aureispira sp.]
MERYKQIIKSLGKAKRQGVAIFSLIYNGKMEGAKLTIDIEKVSGGKTVSLLKWMNTSSGRGQDEEKAIQTVIKDRMNMFVAKFKEYKNLENAFFNSVTQQPSFRIIHGEYQKDIARAHKQNVKIYMSLQKLLGESKQEMEFATYKALMKKPVQLRERVRKEEEKVKKILAMGTKLKDFKQQILELDVSSLAEDKIENSKQMLQKVQAMSAKFLKLVPAA